MQPSRLRLILAGTILLLLSGIAPAATYTVNRVDDPAPHTCTAFSCSLREAVRSANERAGADRIVLPAGTYSLSRVDTSPSSLEAGVGALWVSDSVAIVGAGAGTTRIRWSASPHGTPGAGRNEILAVEQATGGVALDLQGVTVSDARGEYGGCITVRGAPAIAHELLLRDVIVEDCATSGFGGAISIAGGNLTMSDVQLRNNTADFDGGAIVFSRTSDVISSNVQISGNAARSGGGFSIAGSPDYLPNVVWIDDGTLVMRNNTALTGGAIYTSLAALTLESASQASAGRWIELRENSAVDGGAVAVHAPQLVTRFSGVRFLRNRAESGGAVRAGSSLEVSNAEFSDNQASVGDGGALRSISGAVAQTDVFDRVSFRNNIAKGGGGAIRSGCRGFQASNVSFGGNVAAASRGQAIENTGPARLHHATVHANLSPSAGTSPGILQMLDAGCGDASNEIMRLANSIVTDYCGFNIARLRSEGGNQYGPNAGVCPAAANDRRQTSNAPLRLSSGRFGGPVDVWGWTNTHLGPVPQRDFGARPACLAVDVRGFARSDGKCDSGAFEQQ